MVLWQRHNSLRHATIILGFSPVLFCASECYLHSWTYILREFIGLNAHFSSSVLLLLFASSSFSTNTTWTECETVHPTIYADLLFVLFWTHSLGSGVLCWWSETSLLSGFGCACWAIRGDNTTMWPWWQRLRSRKRRRIKIMQRKRESEISRMVRRTKTGEYRYLGRYVNRTLSCLGNGGRKWVVLALCVVLSHDGHSRNTTWSTH